MTPIRTLQLGMEWFPEKPGGLNRVYFELTRRLPAAGVEVRGLVAGTERVAADSGGAIQAFAPMTASTVSRLMAVRRLARERMTAGADALVVAHFALYAWPVLGSLGTHRLVVHFHGPWGMEGGAERQSAITVAMKEHVERAVYSRAAACIVLSRPFGDILARRFGVGEDRIHVIPGGVDCARFAAALSRAECRKKLGWPPDRPTVLAVRRLAHRMGMSDLVAATTRIRARVPGALVCIAGSGPLAADLEARIASAALGDSVRLLGFVSDDQLPLAYRAADVTIVPSVALEGFGLIVAESLAAGTPCLVTPVGGLPDAVVGLSRDLILEGTGADAIADGLIGALSGTTRLPDAQACREFARKNYDWSVVVERTRRVYEGALA